MSARSLSASSNIDISDVLQIKDQRLSPLARSKVQKRLMQDAQQLIARKLREKEARKRVEDLEKSLEIQKQQKLKLISKKHEKSQKNLATIKSTQANKFKLKQQYFNAVKQKAHRQQQERISSALEKQRQYRKQTVGSKIFKATATTSIQTPHKNLDVSDVDSFLTQIKTRTERASQNSNHFKKQIIQKLKQRSESVRDTYQKVLNNSVGEQYQTIGRFYKKAQNIQRVNLIAHTQRQKKIEAHKMSHKYRLEKLHEKLNSISYSQHQRNSVLETKMGRKVKPKEWKDIKLQKYLQLCQKNIGRINDEKEKKAVRILQKHEQITNCNHIYRFKKQQLMQTLKHL